MLTDSLNIRYGRDFFFCSFSVGLLLMTVFDCVHRLGISYPELNEMQAQAIFQTAVSMNNQGLTAFPEIMVPLFNIHEQLLTLNRFGV